GGVGDPVDRERGDRALDLAHGRRVHLVLRVALARDAGRREVQGAGGPVLRPHERVLVLAGTGTHRGRDTRGRRATWTLERQRRAPGQHLAVADRGAPLVLLGDRALRAPRRDRVGGAEHEHVGAV